MHFKTQHLRILLELYEEGPLDSIEIAKRLKIKEKSVKKYLKPLISQDFVRKLDEKFLLTNRGNFFINSITNSLSEVKEEEEYVFRDLNGNAITLAIRDLKQLCAVIELNLVDREIILHHLKSRYLSRWIENSVRDNYLANEILELLEKTSEKELIDRVLDLIKERLKVTSDFNSIQNESKP